MKLYRGVRREEGCQVTVNGAELDPRLDLWNHSPTGFEWGYGGSGPAQTALAILADVLGDDDLAVQLHQRFKFAVIGGIKVSTWNLSEQQVKDWVDATLEVLNTPNEPWMEVEEVGRGEPETDDPR